MTTSPATARAWVDIDLGALVANARTVAATCGARLLPMVKANGYGLGAAQVAQALEAVDPWGFGVATAEEGAALRSAGCNRPLLVAAPLDPASVDSHLAADLRPSIGDLEALRAWRARTDRPFHLEIDTGMARAGFRWDDRHALDAVAGEASDAPGWEGVYTHFHSADTDAASIECQWDRFRAVLAALPRRPPLIHAANSAAALRGPAFAADLVRPGIFLYGGDAGGVAPRPVVSLHARVVAVRRVGVGDTVSYGASWRAPSATTIATAAVGYADGFPRASEVARSHPRVVELQGRKVVVAGRVTMDMIMVAVDQGPVRVGDVVTVFGGIVSLDDQARAAGTISYELLTSMGARLPRLYAGAT
ncbi:MAG TPA: alanine racemase [Gemmatimonadales bacterium]|nr:alanine racemase [Gemmatimonadales bacterium]